MDHQRKTHTKILVLRSSFPFPVSCSFPWLVITIIEAYITRRRYSRERQAGREPFRSKIFIFMFILAIILVGSTAFITYKAYSKNQTRIVLLGPIDLDRTSAPYKSGERILSGYIDFLRENVSLTKDFSIVIANHAMSVDTATKIICDELSQGTEYFVCTMSEVASTLSSRFNELVDHCRRWWHFNDPKLIFTFTSTPNIDFQGERIYRFYIRSEEEARHLALVGNQPNFNQMAASIVVNDGYGQDAVEEFKMQWENLDNQLGTRIDLGQMWNRAAIMREIQAHFTELGAADIIFIAHHGSGICDIVCSLDELEIRSPILITSPILSWQTSIQNHLDNFEYWKTCVPRTTTSELYSGDLIKDFTRFTLKRLISIINSSKIPGKIFPRCWLECEHPQEIAFEPLERDAIIIMQPFP